MDSLERRLVVAHMTLDPSTHREMLVVLRGFNRVLKNVSGTRRSGIWGISPSGWNQSIKYIRPNWASKYDKIEMLHEFRRLFQNKLQAESNLPLWQNSNNFLSTKYHYIDTTLYAAMNRHEENKSKIMQYMQSPGHKASLNYKFNKLNAIATQNAVGQAIRQCQDRRNNLPVISTCLAISGGSLSPDIRDNVAMVEGLANMLNALLSGWSASLDRLGTS